MEKRDREEMITNLQISILPLLTCPQPLITCNSLLLMVSLFCTELRLWYFTYRFKLVRSPFLPVITTQSFQCQQFAYTR